MHLGPLVLHDGVKYLQLMRRSAKKRKKLDYPEETEGSRLAAKVRKLASKLSPEGEAEHFRRAMAKIYGSQTREITGARQ